MPVDSLHPHYVEMLPDTVMVADCVSGQSKVKAKRTTYLPGLTDATGVSDEARYSKYIARAYFMGVTGRTLDAIKGMAFRKEPAVSLPTAIDYMVEDADGCGQSLNQIAKQAFTGLNQAGRYFFLSDYTPVEAGISAEEEAAIGARPYVRCYPSESVINWKTENNQLILAVLVEAVDIAEDEFSHTTAAQYRVLRMRDGVYTQQLYDHKKQPITQEITPLQAGGVPFDHIPLHKAGATSNIPDTLDVPPLFDMAVLNIAHYQTTADHRENLHVHGQLTLGITTDLDSQTWKELYPTGVSVGARTGIYLGTTGAFHTATAPESGSLRIALDDLEKQMVAIGAKLIQRGGSTETAEAARIAASAETSALDDMVTNLSEALESALEDCAAFGGANPEEVVYQINRDFWESKLDVAALQAIIAGRQAGLLGATDALHMIRTGKMELREERTDEEILLEVADDLLNQLPEAANDTLGV